MVTPQWLQRLSTLVTRQRMTLGVLLCTLVLAGCHQRAHPPVDPPADDPPPDPPSGEVRPEAPIPYATLAEHLGFNTRSRMGLVRLQGQVVRVHGPVWRVEPLDYGAVLRLGSERGSVVRAIFANADALQGVREGQEVDVVGRFAFRGTDLLLEDAHLQK